MEKLIWIIEHLSTANWWHVHVFKEKAIDYEGAVALSIAFSIYLFIMFQFAIGSYFTINKAKAKWIHVLGSVCYAFTDMLINFIVFFLFINIFGFYGAAVSSVLYTTYKAIETGNESEFGFDIGEKFYDYFEYLRKYYKQVSKWKQEYNNLKNLEI